MKEAALKKEPGLKTEREGMVQIFTGDGKGKTTAALGEVLRSSGHGLKVYIIVFMKGDYPYGEWEVLGRFPNVTIERFGFREFTDPHHVKPEEREQAEQALRRAREVVRSGEYDIVVLDEVNIACAWRLIDTGDVVDLIKERPKHVELILTGRAADPALIETADLVTECRKVKHPYDRGIIAREGIEY